MVFMDYTNLNLDVELTPKPYGLYDLNYVAGDIVQTKGLNSLRNAIIIKIMTAFQELYNTGNITYQDFGNHVWSQIKANHTESTHYKIEQYTLQALKEIRRIKSVDELKVIEDENYDGYNVKYTVTALNDEQLTDNILLTELKDGLKTFMDFSVVYSPTTSEHNHCYDFNIRLVDEFNNPLTGEICYIYINNHYYRVTPQTNFNGETTIRYPKLLYENDKVTAIFKGDNIYNTVKNTFTVKGD